jgi:hypothetical protein
MTKSLDLTTCVFCAKMPRRQAAGICGYPMRRSIHHGIHKTFQTIETTTRTLRLPICAQCRNAMKLLTRATVAILAVLLLLVSILFLYVGPVNVEKGKPVTTAHIVLLILAVLVSISLPIVRYHIRKRYALIRLNLPELIITGRPTLAEFRQLRKDALKNSQDVGGLGSVPEVLDLYGDEYSTSWMFEIFPSGSVKLF